MKAKCKNGAFYPNQNWSKESKDPKRGPVPTLPEPWYGDCCT